MNNESLNMMLLIFSVVYISTTIAYFIARRYMRRQDKKFNMERARLDDYRAHLERQLTELNMRFSSSESRWQELNHLVVSGQSNERSSFRAGGRVQASPFLDAHGIDADSLSVNPDMIFVLTSFHEDFFDEYESIVKVGQKYGMVVKRGDEKAISGDIFPVILKMIVEARIIIANISGRNPNVFYELGIAHALSKTVILLAHNKSDVPFDIRAKQIVFYNSNEDLRNGLEMMLPRALVPALG